jgi:hypothetical protein
MVIHSKLMILRSFLFLVDEISHFAAKEQFLSQPRVHAAREKLRRSKWRNMCASNQGD